MRLADLSATQVALPVPFGHASPTARVQRARWGDMRSDIQQIVQSFAGQRVLVVGDAILDRYLHGGDLRFCREAPVPNVTVERSVDRGGGAGNTALNARALGADVTFIGVLGDDAAGDGLIGLLESAGVHTAGTIRQRGRATRAKHRVIASSQLLLSFDTGARDTVDTGSERALMTALLDRSVAYDGIVVADYGYGTMTDGVIGALTYRRRDALPERLVVDSRHRLPQFAIARPDAVKPNFEEACELVPELARGGRPERGPSVQQAGARLRGLTGARLTAVTLDCDGAVLVSPDASHRVMAPPVPMPLAAGAGDTFTATLALALAAGAPDAVAGELACRAASCVVGKEGTATCSAAELLGCFSDAAKRIDSVAALALLAEKYRAQGRRIALTNGCFDILHRGHIALLNQARTLGDVLIVGVNGDDSIRRVKGPGRPINTLEDRLQVLSALGCVDHVIAFHEDTSNALVRAARPDVFVKGGSYTRETLPEAGAVEECGGTVHLLPYLAESSTTRLIERLSNRPASEVAAW